MWASRGLGAGTRAALRGSRGGAGASGLVALSPSPRLPLRGPEGSVRGGDSALGTRAPRCRGPCVEGETEARAGAGGQGVPLAGVASGRARRGEGAVFRETGLRGPRQGLGRGQRTAAGRPSHGDQAAPATPARRTEAIGHVPAARGPLGWPPATPRPRGAGKQRAGPAGQRRETDGRKGGAGEQAACGGGAPSGRGRPRTGPRVLGPCGRVERERRPEVRGHRPRFTPEAGGWGGDAPAPQTARPAGSGRGSGRGSG